MTTLDRRHAVDPTTGKTTHAAPADSLNHEFESAERSPVYVDCVTTPDGETANVTGLCTFKVVEVEAPCKYHPDADNVPS